MPEITRKTEGRGNGIKTRLVNIKDVAMALKRKPEDIVNFLGKELGSQTVIKVKDNLYVINGIHDFEDIQNLIHKFIKLYVLCRECDNPETELRVTSKNLLEQNCLACGHCSKDINPTHKLTTAIINHHKIHSKKKVKVDSKKKVCAAGSVAYGISSSFELVVPVIEESLSESEWDTDVSEETVKLRASQIGDGVINLVQTDDFQLTDTEKLKLFSKFVEEKKKLSKFPSKEVLKEVTRLEIKDKGVMVLVEHLISSSKDIFKSIKMFQGLFQRFTMDSTKSQKYMIGSLEVLFIERPELMTKIEKCFKYLYDLDILDEDVIISWGEKSSKKYVSKVKNQIIRDKCSNFIEWLKNTDEEDSEDEEHNIIFTSEVGVIDVEKSNVQIVNEEYDDINIDEI